MNTKGLLKGLRWSDLRVSIVTLISHVGIHQTTNHQGFKRRKDWSAKNHRKSRVEVVKIFWQEKVDGVENLRQSLNLLSGDP